MPTPLHLLPFVCLFGAILSQLIGWRLPAMALGLAALGGAHAAGLADPRALAWSLAATALLAVHLRRPELRALSAPLLVAWALAASLHMLPGFSPLPWRDDFGRLGIGVLRWQLDKGLAGLLLLLAFLHTRPAWTAPRPQFAVLLACVAGLPMLGWALGLARPDPAWPADAAIWILGNLFLTVVAEEAFFRLCLQHPLDRWLAHRTRHATVWAIALSAAFFAVVHAPWGAGFACLAGVAGLAYAWLGRRPELLGWSIACHALTNAAILLAMRSPFG